LSLIDEMRQLEGVLGRGRLDRISHVALDESNVQERQNLPGGDYILLPRSCAFDRVRQYVEAALPPP
jgi:hypothetical protein